MGSDGNYLLHMYSFSSFLLLLNGVLLRKSSGELLEVTAQKVTFTYLAIKKRKKYIAHEQSTLYKPATASVTSGLTIDTEQVYCKIFSEEKSI